MRYPANVSPGSSFGNLGGVRSVASAMFKPPPFGTRFRRRGPAVEWEVGPPPAAVPPPRTMVRLPGKPARRHPSRNEPRPYEHLGGLRPGCASGDRRAAARKGGVGEDRGRETREVAGAQLLRAVAHRLLGLVVDLDDDAVGADRGRAARERLDEAAVAR